MKIIKDKEDIINYFKEGIKDKTNFKIGVEYERFLYNDHNIRVKFSEIQKLFDYLKKFSWIEVKEDNEVIALKRDNQTIPF